MQGRRAAGSGRSGELRQILQKTVRGLSREQLRATRRDLARVCERVEPCGARRDRQFERGVEQGEHLAPVLGRDLAHARPPSRTGPPYATARERREKVFALRWRKSPRQCVLSSVTTLFGSGRTHEVMRKLLHHRHRIHRRLAAGALQPANRWPRRSREPASATPPIDAAAKTAPRCSRGLIGFVDRRLNGLGGNGRVLRRLPHAERQSAAFAGQRAGAIRTAAMAPRVESARAGSAVPPDRRGRFSRQRRQGQRLQQSARERPGARDDAAAAEHAPHRSGDECGFDRNHDGCVAHGAEREQRASSPAPMARIRHGRAVRT